MIGAIAGDIIGSVYERNPVKSLNFKLFAPGCRFTDDSVMTVAVADALMSGACADERLYIQKMQAYGQIYPNAGYGGMFGNWLFLKTPKPYHSFGNGSAMRVSPVGYLLNDMDSVLIQAEKSASVSHDHPEGIKGAQAVAAAIYLARNGHPKEAMKDFLTENFGYDLDRTLAEIRPDYTFDVTCQGSVPESLIAFLESEHYEDAVRKAISLGGDSDTMACIAGGIAEAYYGVPESIAARAKEFLDRRMIEQIEKFYQCLKKEL
jgi:ADP-ribosylglycohydrolase